MERNIELEILKVIKTDFDKINEFIVKGVDESLFLEPKYKDVFKAFKVIDEQSLVLNDTVLANELSKLSNINSNEIIYEINNVDKEEIKNIPYYIAEMKKKYKSVTVGDKIKQHLKNFGPEDADLVTSKIINDIEEVDIMLESGENEEDLQSVIAELFARYDKIANGVDEFSTKSTYKAIDEMIGGYEEGSLNILAARPSMGKTALALNIASRISFKKNVLFFSLEMSSMMLSQRLLSMATGIGGDRFRVPKDLTVDEKESMKEYHTNVAANQKMILDDASGKPSIENISAKIKRYNKMGKVDVVVIDYLQLLSSSSNKRNDNRQVEVSLISRKLKLLAKELNIPIIALAQLSRQVEMRENKTPMMSDLRESGAIEQDADTIMFLYRKAYYDKEAATDNQEVDVIISKNRNGATGVAKLAFTPSIGKFENISFPTIKSEDDYE